MGLKLSTNSQASAHVYENSTGQGSTDVELAQVDVNTYDTLQQGDRDEHTYGVAGRAPTPSDRKVLGSSEVTLSRRSAIIMAVSGVILSAMISIITGVVVYHVANGKITDTEHKITQLQVQLEETKANTRQELDALNKTQTEARQQVAFSVYAFNSDLLPDFMPTFRYTATNTGHYNMTSGRFTCPVAGLYYFSLTIEHDSTSRGTLYCDFRVNGFVSVHVTARQGPYEVTSDSVIQHLSVNDVVSLYCRDWKYVWLDGDNTVFSGFLISQD